MVCRDSKVEKEKVGLPRIRRVKEELCGLKEFLIDS